MKKILLLILVMFAIIIHFKDGRPDLKVKQIFSGPAGCNIIRVLYEDEHYRLRERILPIQEIEVENQDGGIPQQNMPD